MEGRAVIRNFEANKYKHIEKYGVEGIQEFEINCIGYVIKGYGDFLYNGKSFRAYEGDVIYIAKGTKYCSVWNGNPDIEFYSMPFDYINPYEMREYKFQIVKNIDGQLYKKVYEKYNDGEMFEAMGYFYLLLSDLYKHMEKSYTDRRYTSLEPAVKYLREHFCEDIKISCLSMMCGFSESRFQHLFKEVMGCTPITYKNNLIIEEAVSLLSNTDMTVEAISEKLKFSSPAYFRKIFKNVTGKNPKDIRKGEEITIYRDDKL